MWDKLDRTDTPIIDRRTEDTNEPSAEDRASDEKDRLARRENLKIKAAECRLLLDQAELLQGELRRLDREAEQAADVHSAACGPLQEELERLEQAAILRITRREPADAKADNRRSKIYGLIERENQALQDTSDRIKRLRGPLEGRIAKLQLDAAPLQALQNQLTNIGIGDPQLIIEHHCSQQRVSFATARLGAAKKALGIVEYNLREICADRMSGGRREMSFRVARWQAEVEAAGREQADAMAAGSSIHAAMIAE